MWIAFIAIAGGLLALDLFAHRHDRAISVSQAAWWSAMYVAMALMFASFVLVHRGPEDAGLFLTAYALEKVLSVDNLMMFSAVFTYFGIQSKYQHRVLYWGILGAVVMRLVFVYFGTSLLDWFGKPVEIAFALVVAWSATGVWGSSDEPKEVDHRNRWYIRGLRRFLPVTEAMHQLKPSYPHGGPRASFFLNAVVWDHVRNAPKHEPPRRTWSATPLFLCLVAVEMTDVAFAVDSVPVVIAVARDPFIVYSAMIFAILGLRSLYFVLAALQRALKHLGKAVAIILVGVAAKLLLGAIWDYHVDPLLSLGITLALLTGGVLASLLDRKTPAGTAG